MGLEKNLDQMRTGELLLLSVCTNTKLTRPLIKFQNGHRLEVLFVNVRDDFGFQRNDNMSLDVSGQVRKLHGCMTDTFTLRVGHLALGCHFHVDILFFFATSLVLRCGIRSEMSTPNFKTTLHTVFGSCFRNKWACSLLFSSFPPLLSIQGM